MAELIQGIDAATVARNLEPVLEQAGEGVEILVACKYVPAESMGELAEAGVAVVGENRLQDLEAKQESAGGLFTWDFIGNIQSRKLPRIAAAVRRIHSVCTDSVLKRLGNLEGPPPELYVQVDLADEESKGGVAPAELGAFIERCPHPIGGLSTMPPFTGDPEDSRRYFAGLAELAGEHGLSGLSMGTSQDWEIALQEGATTLRLGRSLFEA